MREELWAACLSVSRSASERMNDLIRGRDGV